VAHRTGKTCSYQETEMKHSRRLARTCAVLLALLGCQATPAVEVDPGGSGQVLLLPLWTTTGGHSTLLNIQNLHETASYRKIAKLRLRDQEGAVVFSGSLYFHDPQDAWTAGIGPREGGGSRLISSDETCLLVDGEQGAEPFSGMADLDAEYGSAEVILMGSGWTVPADQQFPIQWDVVCSQLADKWNVGEWESNPNTPSIHEAYQLFAEWQIIQVEGGVVYKVPGVAIDGYSDRVQHTRPGDPLPDLASGHDTGTDEGKTKSRVCSNGKCREDTWPTPLDAMAAALMVDHFRGSYNINPNLGAATDLVINYPLVMYFSERDGLGSPVDHAVPLGHSFVQMATYDRVGNDRVPQGCVGVPQLECWDTEWSAPQPLDPQALPIMAVSFNPAESQIAPSAVLDLPGAWRMEFPSENEYQLPPLPSEGSFHARPSSNSLNYGWSMISNEGNGFRGAPAIPVVFQRYVNGVLEGSDGVPQRANYSFAFAPAIWAWDITWDDTGED